MGLKVAVKISESVQFEPAQIIIKTVAFDLILNQLWLLCVTFGIKQLKFLDSTSKRESDVTLKQIVSFQNIF
jgi:hypothetical protein